MALLVRFSYRRNLSCQTDRITRMNQTLHISDDKEGLLAAVLAEELERQSFPDEFLFCTPFDLIDDFQI